MSFINVAQMLDAKRLSKVAKATVQQQGRLGFSADAQRLMELENGKSIIFFEATDGDLGAVVTLQADERGFALRKSGPYYYLRMKNYFDERQIDYRKKRVIYDIAELNETFEEMKVFKFSRRILERGSTEDREEEGED